MELHPTSLHLETTATATGQSLVVGRPGHCRNFVTAAGAPHTTCQSHRPPQVVTTRNVSRYYSATTKNSPPVENHCSRERIKHLRRFQHRGTERRQDTCKSPGAARPRGRRPAVSPAVCSGHARGQPQCSVKAQHCRAPQDFWFWTPLALSQHHPPPRRALSAQRTCLSCPQASLTGCPGFAPRPRHCHVDTRHLARP